MRVRFWGVRGSVPVPGPSTVQVGGNTACVEVRTPDGGFLILDAGTGIRTLGNHLLHHHAGRVIGTIFFSHTHWDHIQGFPFFAPARLRHNRFVIFGEKRIGERLERVLQDQMRDSYLPFGFQDMEADLLVKEVQVGEAIAVGEETIVQAEPLYHPGGVFGYRIECRGRSVTYATDLGHPSERLDPRVLALAQETDLLIHDAQFHPHEKRAHPDWGHSSWEEAALVARGAGVRRLALFHHSPDHTDADLFEIERQAQAVFAATGLAREGDVIDLEKLDGP
jgi:phosphoribosyl 1,2-cyclic phosphodiesterase